MPKRNVKRHVPIQPLSESYRYIALTQGQNAIVDAQDFEWLNQWNWNAWLEPDTHCFYAIRNIRKPHQKHQGAIRMHRLILGCKKGEWGDHKNHNTLDNRRENLRKCTNAQNTKNQRIPKNNTSGFKGARLRKNGKWQAQIGFNGGPRSRTIALGTFDSAKDAAKAYDKAAKKYHGEFANLNFP